MGRERGFVLLEVLAAGLALLVMAMCFHVFAGSAELREADACRVRAVFLARTQFSAAQAAANQKALLAGGYPWQGEAGDLQGGEEVYSVETDVAGAGEGSFKVVVKVAWQGRVRGELELEREVVAHGI